MFLSSSMTTTTYLCLKCGEDVKNDTKRKKEQLKCDHCGGKVVMKKRKPTQYIAN